MKEKKALESAYLPNFLGLRNTARPYD